MSLRTLIFGTPRRVIRLPGGVTWVAPGLPPIWRRRKPKPLPPGWAGYTTEENP